MSRAPSKLSANGQFFSELGFVERRENVIFLGPPGVGTTHLAISLAIAAAQRGRRVYKGRLADLITSLESAVGAPEGFHPSGAAPGRRDRLSAHQPESGAMLFFQLMTRRYEQASMVVTSKKGFEAWGESLGDDIMTAAFSSTRPPPATS